MKYELRTWKGQLIRRFLSSSPAAAIAIAQCEANHRDDGALVRLIDLNEMMETNVTVQWGPGPWLDARPSRPGDCDHYEI